MELPCCIKLYVYRLYGPIAINLGLINQLVFESLTIEDETTLAGRSI